MYTVLSKYFSWYFNLNCFQMALVECQVQIAGQKTKQEIETEATEVLTSRK